MGHENPRPMCLSGRWGPLDPFIQSPKSSEALTTKFYYSLGQHHYQGLFEAIIYMCGFHVRQKIYSKLTLQKKQSKKGSSINWYSIKEIMHLPRACAQNWNKMKGASMALSIKSSSHSNI